MLAFAGLALAPQLWITARYHTTTYSDLHAVPPREYGVVFGAYVNEDGTLTDVARERVDAAVLLFKLGGIQRLFVSGTNRDNQQAEAMARYAEQQGVPTDAILVDPLGIDTHDTCRHIAALTAEAALFTQGYHLPRAMYYCDVEGVRTVGIAVNRLGLLEQRGDNAAQIYWTRLSRWGREALLTWAFLVGAYPRISDEAELLEQ